jgi:hypothetical protein
VVEYVKDAIPPDGQREDPMDVDGLTRGITRDIFASTTDDKHVNLILKNEDSKSLARVICFDKRINL